MKVVRRLSSFSLLTPTYVQQLRTPPRKQLVSQIQALKWFLGWSDLELSFDVIQLLHFDVSHIEMAHT